jgi:photosystem II stability/assembly factor-like uncharacterized protein
MDIDNQYPYRVYGTQQDNSSVSVPSATEKGGIPWSDCYAAGTGESGFIAVHPADANIVYVGAVGSSPGGGGALQRYDHRTKQIRLVTVWPETYTGWGAGDLKYRFPWTFPICFSPHDPGVLYSTGSHVFRSTDEGSSWQAISPDLTRNDSSKLGPSGGPITLDTSGAEHYCCLSTFVESPHEAGVLWVGSDDGLLHRSADGGQSWQNITPPDLPQWTYICNIELSPHDPAIAYVAATRYKLDDNRPFLYKTTDHGASWQSIGATFPQDEITRVIREDPVRRGLLYVGTETGLFVSLDDGASWQRLQNNLPVAPIYDLRIKGSDLVVATHGRSFWVLDDVTPLRQWGEHTGPAHLFAPRTTTRQTLGWSVGMWRGPGKNYAMGLGGVMTFTEEKGEHGEPLRKMLDAGENPPQGVLVYYYLEAAPAAPITLTLRDPQGMVIRTYQSKSNQSDTTASQAKAKDGKTNEERTLPAKPGLNRFVWDLRYPDAEKAPGDVTTEKAVTGPVAAPGRYQVELAVGEQTSMRHFELCADPRVTATPEDLAAQFELWRQICDKISATHGAIKQIRRMSQQIGEWEARAEGAQAIGEAAKSLREKLATIERTLVQTEAKSATDRLRLPSRLNTKLIGLISVVACADARPPQQAYDVFDHLAAQVDEQLALLEGVIGDDVAAFNDLVRAANLTPVAI